MAYHFNANQYNDKYSPRKLGNWEYPKWYQDRPQQRFKSTKIIADNNGRLLDGIRRENPWGHFVGTWDLPRRITREYAEMLAAPPPKIKLWKEKQEKLERENREKVNRKKKRQDQQNQQAVKLEPESVEHTPEFLPALKQSPTAQKTFQKRNKSCSALDLRPNITKLESLTSPLEKEKEDHSVKAGSLADEKIKNILESVERKIKPESTEEICKEIEAFPPTPRDRVDVDYPWAREEIDLGPLGNVRPVEERTTGKGIDESGICRGQQGSADMNGSKKVDETPAAAGIRIAKRYHEENLRHKPLPDVIDNSIIKALTSEKGICPDGGKGPSAIGYKCYAAPGPTECSKMKVYRPKTAVNQVKVEKEQRPKTGEPKTDKLKKRFLPIDLAICWDLKPDDPADEPKRTPHIDGSNGSAAPAVFSMIGQKETTEEGGSVLGSCQAVAERITKGIEEDNVALLPSQTNGKSSFTGRAKPLETPGSVNSISPNTAEYARRNPKTAWSNEDTEKALSDRLRNLEKDYETGAKNPFEEKKKTPNVLGSDSSHTDRKKHYQSTPNLASGCDGSHCGTQKNSPASSNGKSRWGTATPTKMKSDVTVGEKKFQTKSDNNLQRKTRSCSACDISSSDSRENQCKVGGIPKGETSSSGSSGSVSKSYKVPKVRLPYAKRSYSISTLVPPFSLWPETKGQEYPEHWRLASVYQHSYKPINSRKRPLLASVYQ